MLAEALEDGTGGFGDDQGFGVADVDGGVGRCHFGGGDQIGGVIADPRYQPSDRSTMVGDLDRFAALGDLGQVTARVLAQFAYAYLLHVLHGSTWVFADMAARQAPSMSQGNRVISLIPGVADAG